MQHTIHMELWFLCNCFCCLLVFASFLEPLFFFSKGGSARRQFQFQCLQTRPNRLFIYLGSLRLSPCMVATWKVPVEEKVRKANHCPLAVDNTSMSSILQVDSIFLGIINLTLKHIYTNQHGFDFIKYFGLSVELSKLLYQSFGNLNLWNKMSNFVEPSIVSFGKLVLVSLEISFMVSVTECVTRKLNR